MSYSQFFFINGALDREITLVSVEKNQLLTSIN
jgi:hypothetical protein